MADQRVIKQVDNALFVETEPLKKGGAGSGNFGHSGRAGIVGGSGGGAAGGGGNQVVGSTSYGGVPIERITDASDLVTQGYGAIVVSKHGNEVLATKTEEFHNDIVASIHPDKTVDDYIRFRTTNGKLQSDNGSAGIVVDDEESNVDAIDKIYDAIDKLHALGLSEDTGVVIYQGSYGKPIEFGKLSAVGSYLKLIKYKLKKGGAGSGNFGHSGRQGIRGGSGGGGVLGGGYAVGVRQASPSVGERFVIDSKGMVYNATLTHETAATDLGYDDLDEFIESGGVRVAYSVNQDGEKETMFDTKDVNAQTLWQLQALYTSGKVDVPDGKVFWGGGITNESMAEGFFPKDDFMSADGAVARQGKIVLKSLAKRKKIHPVAPPAGDIPR
jgi:hypothetical protein